MREFFRLSVILMLLTLSGCMATFKNPVVDRKEKGFDSKLCGMWMIEKTTDAEDYGFLMFLPNRDGKVHVLYYEENETMYFKDVLSSSVKGEHYLNLKSDDMEDYFLARYEFVGNDELKIVLANPDYIKKMIEEKKLPGILSTSQTMMRPDTIQVTASTKELRKFLESADKNSLFDDKNAPVFKKREIGMPASIGKDEMRKLGGK